MALHSGLAFPATGFPLQPFPWHTLCFALKRFISRENQLLGKRMSAMRSLLLPQWSNSLRHSRSRCFSTVHGPVAAASSRRQLGSRYHAKNLTLFRWQSHHPAADNRAKPLTNYCFGHKDTLLPHHPPFIFNPGLIITLLD